jgi:hypothetical protein
VSCCARYPPTPTAGTQPSEELEVHVVVPHPVAPITRFGLTSTEWKLRPSTVTDAPDDEGTLAFIEYEKTGLSNVNEFMSVLKRPPTSRLVVSLAFASFAARPPYNGGAHVITVVETQIVDWHKDAPIRAVGVVFSIAKFVPSSVSTEPPVKGAFGTSLCEITGLSNVKAESRHPTRSLTTIEICSASPYPAGVRHVRRVTEVHDVVAQDVPPIPPDVAPAPTGIPT